MQNPGRLFLTSANMSDFLPAGGARAITFIYKKEVQIFF